MCGQLCSVLRDRTHGQRHGPQNEWASCGLGGFKAFLFLAAQLRSSSGNSTVAQMLIQHQL